MPLGPPPGPPPDDGDAFVADGDDDDEPPPAPPPNGASSAEGNDFAATEVDGAARAAGGAFDDATADCDTGNAASIAAAAGAAVITAAAGGAAAAAAAARIAQLEAELGSWRRGEKRAFACVDITETDDGDEAEFPETIVVGSAAVAANANATGASDSALRLYADQTEHLVRVMCERESAALDADAARRALECAICFEREADTVLLPCSHMCACAPCADGLPENALGQRQCPMCRAPFLLESVVRVKRA